MTIIYDLTLNINSKNTSVLLSLTFSWFDDLHIAYLYTIGFIFAPLIVGYWLQPYWIVPCSEFHAVNYPMHAVICPIQWIIPYSELSERQWITQCCELSHAEEIIPCSELSHAVNYPMQWIIPCSELSHAVNYPMQWIIPCSELSLCTVSYPMQRELSHVVNYPMHTHCTVNYSMHIHCTVSYPMQWIIPHCE